MQNNRLIVLSEGPHHIAIFKPHNLATVGGRGVVRPTLLDLVRQRFGQSVYAVHRLDRATAGIILFARSLFAKHAIDNAFKKRLVKKIYYAICEGKPSFSKTTVTKNLLKVDTAHKKGPQKRQSIDEGGQSASTNFRVLKQMGSFCLIEAQPLSGRMHQIRAHLADLGLPIVGDKLYGAKSTLSPHTIALCAVQISLPLPKGGRLDIDARHLFMPTDYIKDEAQ